MRLLTLNLWNINEPLTARMRELGQFVEVLLPDVMAFQEVSLVGGQPQTEVIARSFGYSSSYARSGTWKGREEGLATLTRLPSISSEIVALPEAKGDMSRIALAVILSGHNSLSEIAVVNTHLAFQRRHRHARLRQIRACLTFAAKVMEARRGLVLCGDLNNFPGEKIVEEVMERGPVKFQSCWTKYDTESGPPETFSSNNPWAAQELFPGRTIDHVFVSPSMLIERCMIVLRGTDGWHPVSDHFGVLTEIRMKEHS